MPGTEPARTKPNILVVDDDIYLLAAIQQTLLLNGYLADVCNAPLEAMERIGPATSHAAVIADVKMPRMNGIDLQVCIREMDPDLPVILITGHGDVAMAVKAMKAGAYDFLEKPVDEDALLASLARAVEKRHLVEENRKLAGRLRHEREERLCFHGLVGSHPLMRRLHEILDVVAAEEAPVLISGETGTGKEVVARAVHALSTRAEDPFVAVNMGAIPGEMLEAELFGFDKGAFTGATQAKAGKFELAGKGSLFLDEICSLPPGLQGKLLRVLEERSITRLGSNTAIPLKSRIIAATNKDLGQEIQRGSFRSDLYFRLNVLPIELPPLRERRSDIPLLIDYFRELYGQERKQALPDFTPELIAELCRRDWPGNIRELRNEVLRLCIFGPGGLAGRGTRNGTDTTEGTAGDTGQNFRPLREHLDATERSYLEQVLRAHHGHIARSHQALGITRKCLYDKISRHGLDLASFRTGEGQDGQRDIMP